MKQIIYLLTVLPLFLLWGCNSDDFESDPMPEAGDKIKFEIGFVPQNDDKPQTRVATAPDFTSAWENGDAIGIFAVKRAASNNTATLQPTGNYMHNVKLIYDGTTWTPDTDLWHASGSDVLDIYAYYPYDASLTNPTNITFAVKADQSGTAYNQSDLLMAKKENVAKSTNAVSLQFAHALSLVQVKVGKEVNVPALDGNFEVKLKNVQATTDFDWTTTPNASGTASDIVMHKVADMDNTYRALVPAQNITEGEQLFTFVQTTTGKEIDFGYKVPTAIALASGKVAQYNITLGWGIDPNWQYAVGDAYPHKGQAIGIVYEISDGGAHGKIVSLDETKNGWAWDSPLQATGATDLDNGMVNIRKVYEFRSNFGNHPPFEFANGINQKYGITTKDYLDPAAKGIWYPPALEELKDLYNAYNAFGKSAFNAKLTAANGTALRSDYYWSSSEDVYNSAWIVSFSNGHTRTNGKDYYLFVRAVSAF